MKKVCPSMSELQAFEAAARHASFTKAASELFVTQGAISRQVANLETWLGTTLFLRLNNRLVLTEEGEFFLEQAQEALRILVESSRHVMSGKGQRHYVTISVPPTLTIRLLMRLLVDFYQAYPSIRLNFPPYEHLDDFRQNEEVDVSIQYGEGEWPGMVTSYLVGKEQAVICTPSYAQELELDSPHRLMKATLLQHFNVPQAWVQWFRENRLPIATAHIGPSFSQYEMIIQAARLGMGVGLVPRCLVSDELRNKTELVEPVPTRQLARQGYFLCVRKERSEDKAVRTVVEWMRGLDFGPFISPNPAWDE